jgi:hypothetical protein
MEAIESKNFTYVSIMTLRNTFPKVQGQPAATSSEKSSESVKAQPSSHQKKRSSKP